MYYLEINQLSMFHTSAIILRKQNFKFKSVKISIINSAVLSLFYFYHFFVDSITLLSDLKIINAC